MRRVSLKRAQEDRAYKPIHDAVIERDGRCMASYIGWGACEGGWDVHHIVSRARAPLLALEPSNLTTLCRRHHRMTHDNPHSATERGLIRSAGAPCPEAPR